MAGQNALLGLEAVPAFPGSYALQLRVTKEAWVPVGRLGERYFPAGEYVYLGCAFGPGGLRARLRHHLGQALSPRWHIDHLRRAASVAGGWFSTSPQRMECAWSLALLETPGIEIPVPYFGASDCRNGCRAHLVAITDRYNEDELEAVLRAALPGEDADVLGRFWTETR